MRSFKLRAKPTMTYCRQKRDCRCAWPWLAWSAASHREQALLWIETPPGLPRGRFQDRGPQDSWLVCKAMFFLSSPRHASELTFSQVTNYEARRNNVVLHVRFNFRISAVAHLCGQKPVPLSISLARGRSDPWEADSRPVMPHQIIREAKNVFSWRIERIKSWEFNIGLEFGFLKNVFKMSKLKIPRWIISRRNPKNLWLFPRCCSWLMRCSFVNLDEAPPGGALMQRGGKGAISLCSAGLGKWKRNGSLGWDLSVTYH